MLDVRMEGKWMVDEKNGQETWLLFINNQYEISWLN